MATKKGKEPPVEREETDLDAADFSSYDSIQRNLENVYNALVKGQISAFMSDKAVSVIREARLTLGEKASKHHMLKRCEESDRRPVGPRGVGTGSPFGVMNGGKSG